jgi:uncharacterized protein YjbI with pentapeptide repeats
MTKHLTVLITASLATLLIAFATAPFACADIFQWEYINPANPAQGKQPSTMLCVDGAGANAVPAANLSYRNLTMAYLIGADLSAFSIYDEEGNVIDSYFADLTGANLSQADLTNANLNYATLTGANLTGAEVRGANFSITSITAAQLYSTASYQAHDLTGIVLQGVNLAGLNVAGQNLTNANFSFATLTGANLSGADARGAIFHLATLSSANFTDADVRGASFGRDEVYRPNSGISLAQLYSTASYQAHDLTGIGLWGNNLAGANLASQNLTYADFTNATLTNANFSQANLSDASFSETTLTNANFTQANLTNANFSGSLSCDDVNCYVTPGADLSGANLSGANVTNANFSGYDYCLELSCGHIVPGADLTGANLSGADARGANFQYATLSGANTSNLIQSNGRIAGLDLTAGATLLIRDYDGNPAVAPPAGPLPIIVEQHLAMDAAGTLRMVFDADPWDSTISFAPGIAVVLSGTLELTFAPGVDVATQSGRTIDLFDWTGVVPTGAFTVSSPYTWNLSNLYTTGEVALTAVPSLPGDFNLDGTVDAADYVVWRKGISVAPTQENYYIWRTHFGQPGGSSATLLAVKSLSVAVPEPATSTLAVVCIIGLFPSKRRGCCNR